MMGKAYLADREAAMSEAKAAQGTPLNPLDVQRLLLDQQKFNWQQGVDKGRFTLDEQEFKRQQDVDKRRLTLDEANQTLREKEYDDKQRTGFLQNYTYPDQGAPSEQIGAEIWKMAKASGVAPEAITQYVKRVADTKGIDWKNVNPNSITALTEEAMRLMAQERGKR
jgi:hypothetical protein